MSLSFMSLLKSKYFLLLALFFVAYFSYNHFKESSPQTLTPEEMTFHKKMKKRFSHSKRFFYENKSIPHRKLASIDLNLRLFLLTTFRE